MKKTLYIALAFTAVLVSCQKELNDNNDIDNNVNEQIEGPEVASSDAIPHEITAVITDESLKTAYAADGDFTWLDSDQVRLLVCQDKTTYSKQGIYTYRIKTLSTDKKTAVFTSTSSAGDLTAFVDGTWKSTGYAMYPTTVLDRFNTPEAHDYGAPWFTLARGNVTGAQSDIILVGMQNGDNSNFNFKTAMAVLKITVKNVPAKAAALKLCTSDKSNYPVDGDFALSDTDNDGVAELTFLPAWVSDFKGYQKVDLSGQGEIASADYYFNIPAASYPANTLSILIEDADGGQIFKRTFNKELVLARNDSYESYPLSYSYSITLTGAANNPSVNWKIDCKRVRFCVSQNATIDISEFNSGYTFANDLATGSYSGTYSLSSFTNQRPSATGQYYMHYILQSDRGGLPASLDASNVLSYGTVPFYYLGSDASSFTKQYTFTTIDSGDGQNFWHPGTGSNYTKTMTLAASEDCTLGNIKISELFGKIAYNKPLYGVLTASDASSITFAYNGDDSTDYFFYQTNYFHVAQSADGWASHSTSDVVFNIGSGPALTSEAYLMMKYTQSYPANWGQFIYGYQLVFE